MKHCKDCQFNERTAVPMNNGQLGMMDICNHEECSNPVDAVPLPCGAARSNPDFCGLKGKYFKMKEKEQPKPEGNVIQLT